MAICPECLIQTPVGFKCPDCAKAKPSHLEEITNKQYIKGGLSGIVIGAGAGYIWYQLSMYGALISLAVAYAVGFCVSRAITASIGTKVGLKIQIFAGLITLISIVYNPILIAQYLILGLFPSLASVIIAMSLWCSTCIIKLLAVVIAVWASIRHFRF